MRITTAFQYQVYNADLTSSEVKLFQAQQQESTGLAINQPSDNPVGAQQLVSMQALEDQLSQYQSNLSTARGTLNATDSALQDAQKTMQSAQTIALQAANSATLDSGTRQNLIDQITTLEQSLVNTGNTQDANGNYLFAGQQSGKQPFSVSASGTLVFSGDDNPVTVQGGPSEEIQVNVAGGQLFSTAYSALANLKADLQSGTGSKISKADLSAITTASTSLSDANGLVGARADQVSTLSTFNTKRITELATSVSNVRDVNIAQAATNYQAASTAYQAALEVVSKASNLSLMNYLSTTSL